MRTGILSNFKGDLLGGITAGVIALPLAIALGVSSGLGATAGIYGSIIVGLLASIFGGAPTQISGPTGPAYSCYCIRVCNSFEQPEFNICSNNAFWNLPNYIGVI